MKKLNGKSLLPVNIGDVGGCVFKDLGLEFFIGSQNVFRDARHWIWRGTWRRSQRHTVNRQPLGFLNPKKQLFFPLCNLQRVLLFNRKEILVQTLLTSERDTLDCVTVKFAWKWSEIEGSSSFTSACVPLYQHNVQLQRGTEKVPADYLYFAPYALKHQNIIWQQTASDISSKSRKWSYQNAWFFYLLKRSRTTDSEETNNLL